MDVAMMSDVAVDFSFYFLCFCFLFSLLVFCLRGTKSHVDIACKSVSGVFALLISAYGLSLLQSKSAFAYYNRSEDALRDHVYLKRSLVCISAYFIYDVLAMFNVHCSEHKSPLMLDFVSDRPLIIVHHLVLALVFVPLTLSRLLGGHGCGVALVGAAYVMEASTPFVSMRAILAVHPKMRQSKVYVFNGLIMMTVFFLCRILIFPIFIYKLASVRESSMLNIFFNGTHWCCKMVALLFLTPQLHWFSLMVKGAVKMAKKKAMDKGEEAIKQDAHTFVNNREVNNNVEKKIE